MCNSTRAGYIHILNGAARHKVIFAQKFTYTSGRWAGTQYYRSLMKIRPPFLHRTSRNERGVGVYTRIAQFYSIVGPPRWAHCRSMEGWTSSRSSPQRNRHNMLVLLLMKKQQDSMRGNGPSSSFRDPWKRTGCSTYLHFWGQAESYPETYLRIRQQTVGVDCFKPAFLKATTVTKDFSLYTLTLEVGLRPTKYWACSMLVVGLF